MKYFLELAVDERSPDHSTLTKFKNRLIKSKGWALIAEIYDDITQQALGHGLELAQSSGYQQGTSQRYRVEQPFG